MDWDRNDPFRPGATDPLLGNETYGKEEESFSEAVTNMTTNQSTEYNAYGSQEWAVGSTLNPSMLHSAPLTPLGIALHTLDPSMLQSSDLTPPGVALDIPTGPSVNADVASVSSGIQRSDEET
ncbi:hypothetical protein CFAM422_006235 [Trichoderma lentiforme]|uniref:Uncharacterized protein n=1 Tax=Trichoderma lentiforme TaxID=1567552 RepID=A0A9P4XGH3_9HYPO|nr:hypothetical protein CFAM422_006235 [Trichoderma lentiforme]